MPKIRIWNGNREKSKGAEYQFTVFLLPIFESEGRRERRSGKGKRARLRMKNPMKPAGYQVTVPSLPGLITYGRTESEALEMAEDAIRCHVDSLKKDGEQIPRETLAHFRKLRIPA